MAQAINDVDARAVSTVCVTVWGGQVGAGGKQKKRGNQWHCEKKGSQIEESRSVRGGSIPDQGVSVHPATLCN